MARRSIHCNGIDIVYDDVGEGARPLVLLHGFSGFRGDFAGQFPALAAIGRTLAPDLRGHGDSTHLGCADAYRFDTLVADLVAWLDALDLPAVDLLGHSMAGLVALRTALAHPERVASLILMSTAGRGMDWIRPELVQLAGGLARKAGMSSLAQLLKTRAADDPQRSRADRRLEAEWGAERFWAWRNTRVEAMDPEAYEPLALALYEHASLLPRLGGVCVPTLVMVGEQDRELLAPAQELEAAIPDARRVVIPAAGHQPQNEAPAAWLDAVREHLARARQA